MKRIAIAATVICVAATGAYAKAHDQGQTTAPGADNVGSMTVTGAQGLGSTQGKRPADKGPKADNPAAGNAGR